MNGREKSIIKYLLQHDLVHNKEIATATGLSSRTVSSYLDRIEAEIMPFNVQLVRKPRVGISLVGESSAKAKLLAALDEQTSLATREARERYLVIKLLLTNRAYTLNELADDLFVSRSTVEADFRNVRALLLRDGITIGTSADGLMVLADKAKRERILAKILHTYWGESLAVAQQAGASVPSIKLPQYLQRFFPEQVTAAVMTGLSDFIDATNLRLTDYEIQSLAIHLIMTGSSRTGATPAPSADILPETQQLLAAVSARLGHSFDAAQQVRVNMHVAAIVERERTVTDVPVSLDTARTRVFLMDKLGDLHPDELLLHDLTTHVAAAITRLQQGITISNPYTTEIKRNLPVAFDYAVSLGSDIEQAYAVKLTEDELGFLSLHLEAFFERGSGQARIDAVVVCATGVGTSHLLAQRLEERYRSQLNITRVLDLAALVHAQLNESLIISTIPISGLQQPVVVVSPLLQSTDVKNINLQIARLNGASHVQTILDYLRPELVSVNTAAKDREAVLQAMIATLVNHGILQNEAALSTIAIKREQWASTALNMLALPHLPTEYVNRSAICVQVFPHGLDWGGQRVQVVMFLALTQDATKYTRDMYAIINRIIDDTAFCQRLAASGDDHHVYQELTTYIKKEAEAK